MSLLEKSDEEIIKIADPIWANLVKSSNIKDYGGFTRDLSSQMMYDEKLPYIEDLQRYRVLLLLRYEIVREPLLQVLKLIIVVYL